MSTPTIELPPYYLPRPPMPLDAATVAGFETLYREVLGADGAAIDYALSAPRWQFLCWLADTQNVLLHGSPDPAIGIFEPRKAEDVNAFGDRKAVYAASDGLWPMYFAILDRNQAMTKNNTALRIEHPDGVRSAPYYFFSISREARERRAFVPGAVYILPRDSFEQQPSVAHRGRRVVVAQWASPAPVKPLARLTVGPEDFPLLAEVRGHDDETMFARARADPDGFPWVEPDDVESGFVGDAGGGRLER